VKLIHCGNNSLANPEDQCEKNIFFMPMGLFALASALNQNGIDAEIINSDSERGKKIDEILQFSELDAVGFDCHWVNQSLAVLETAELIKKLKPEVFVFLGGFTASLFAEEILRGHPQIDAIIRGDADLPIVELCNALRDRSPADHGPTGERKPRPLGDVPNLVWRGDGQRIEVNDFSYVATAEEMEGLDFAAIDLLRNWEYYRKRSIYWTRFAPLNFAPLNLSPMFFLEVGRGCRNQCLFCGGSAEAQRRINARRRIAARSVDSVMATIRKAMAFGFRTFFADFEFPRSDEWYKRLFGRVEQEQLGIHFVYSCWGLVSKGVVDALSQGFERAFIQLSPETADVELRRKNKGVSAFYTNDELKECLDYIATKGNVKVQLYFGYFLAFEKAETVLGTLEFIMELILEYPELIEVAYLPFSTDPGSMLFFHPEEYDVDMEVRSFQDYIGEIRDAYVVTKMSSPDMRLFKPRSLSGGDAVELERKIELFRYLFQAYRRSVSYILEKTGSPGIILRILREMDIEVGTDTSEKVKEKLVEISEETDLADPHLLETIEMEGEMQKRPAQQVFQARPQIWLDRGGKASSREDGMESLHA
jgi:radical SAM superfamily enzyme YgiQ (UPF0313 family)